MLGLDRGWMPDDDGDDDEVVVRFNVAVVVLHIT